MPKLYPMTAEQKLNPLGAHLLNYYYSTSQIRGSMQKKVEHPVFTLNSVKEIPIIMKCAEAEGLLTYGLIVVTGGRHRTPLMIHDSQTYILESLGTSKSKVGISSVTQIAIALKHANTPPTTIYTFKDNRQVDAQSCGSDSFIVLKEIFRIKDSLSDFAALEEKTPLSLDSNSIIDQEEREDNYFNAKAEVVQLKNMPPEIAKYSQAQSLVDNYDYKSRALDSSNKENRENRSNESAAQYARRHMKISSMPLNKLSEHSINDKTVKLKARKLVFSNAALEKRRGKHEIILAKMATELSEDKIREIIKESSGLNLIAKHFSKIPASLLETTGTPGAESTQNPDSNTRSPDNAVDAYVAEEMLKRRDETSGIAPRGTASLSSLILAMKSAPRNAMPKTGHGRGRLE